MSNETQRVNPVKTKSAHNNKRPALLVVLSIALLCALVGLYDPIAVTVPYINVRGVSYAVEVADSDDERIRGLSGRVSLAADRGMLFVFTEPAQQCIWMKDMNFSIDIIWLDADGSVLDVREDVSPETYPNQFCSSDSAVYVLELPPGTLAERGIGKGDTIEINL